MNYTHYVLWLRRLGLLMLLYTLCRVIFYLVNWGQYAGATIAQLSGAFLKGFLFDLTTILFINLPITFLSLLPIRMVNRSQYQAWLAIFFQILNIPFLVLNVINAGYFQLSGQRLTPNSDKGIEKVALEQIWYLVAEYWYVSVLALLIVLLVIWYSPAHYYLKPNPSVTRSWATLLCIASLATSVVLYALVWKSQSFISETNSLQAGDLDNLSRNASFNFLGEYFQRIGQRIG